MTSDAARLFHRRQYLLGPEPFTDLPGWRAERVGDRWLSLHPDLACMVVRGPEAEVGLVGTAVDPLRPDRLDADLAAEAAAQTSFGDVVALVASWTGTFVVVWTRGEEARLVADACGLREVFYTTGPEAWVGAEPSLLARVTDLVPDPERDAFEPTGAFDRGARLWPMRRTPFANVRKLIPNHVLHLPSRRAERIYPSEPLRARTLEAGADALVTVLQGGVGALAGRMPLRLALTGGWDSRVLLGAARPVLDRVTCYQIVHARATPQGPMDLRVAQQLADRLGVDFEAVRYPEAVDPVFRDAVDRSLTGGRPRHAMLEHGFLDRPPTVSGFGSEVARFFYPRAGATTAGKLACLVYGEAHPVAVAEFGAWLADAAPLAARLGYDVLDLFYWEQRLGVWGAKSWTETAIASDMVAPFANRALLTVLLGVPGRHRGQEHHPLYRQALQQMWPETLGVPVNPRFRSRVIRTLERTGLYPAYEAVREAWTDRARRRGGAR